MRPPKRHNNSIISGESPRRDTERDSSRDNAGTTKENSSRFKITKPSIMQESIGSDNY